MGSPGWREERLIALFPVRSWGLPQLRSSVSRANTPDEADCVVRTVGDSIALR